jgi:hypothetical protein
MKQRALDYSVIRVRKIKKKKKKISDKQTGCEDQSVVTVTMVTAYDDPFYLCYGHVCMSEQATADT